MRTIIEFDLNEKGETVAVSTPKINRDILIDTFHRKLEKACDTSGNRETLGCVFFKDGYAIATDGHILVKQSLARYGFYQENADNIDGKFIRAKAFAEIRRYNYMDVREDCIIAYKADLKTCAEFPYFVPEREYPDFNEVLRSPDEIGDINNIGIDTEILARLKEVMFSTRAEMLFNGPKKAILIKSMDYTWEDETVLIMPLTLPKDEAEFKQDQDPDKAFKGPEDEEVF